MNHSIGLTVVLRAPVIPSSLRLDESDRAARLVTSFALRPLRHDLLVRRGVIRRAGR